MVHPLLETLTILEAFAIGLMLPQFLIANQYLMYKWPKFTYISIRLQNFFSSVVHNVCGGHGGSRRVA